MNETYFLLGGLVAIILFGFGGCIGSVGATSRFEKEAISKGHAEYLTSEGNQQIFHWK